MKIREMHKDDLSQLAELYQQFWGETSDLEMMRLRYDRMVERGSHLLICAVEEDRLVGSVMGVICEELYGDCKPFLVIENMIVDLQHRRQGIGKLLLEELKRQAKQMDCSQIILVTETQREDARAFYEQNGFDRQSAIGYKMKL